MQRLYLRDGQTLHGDQRRPARPRRPRADAAEIGSIGTRLSEFASSLWGRLTLACLAWGSASFMFQRKKPSDKKTL